MSFTDLHQHVSQALQQEHPEWVHSNGESPVLDQYLARFAHLLAICPAGSSAENTPASARKRN